MLMVENREIIRNQMHAGRGRSSMVVRDSPLGGFDYAVLEF